MDGAFNKVALGAMQIGIGFSGDEERAVFAEIKDQ